MASSSSEDTGRLPQNIRAEISSLCSGGHSPLKITGIILRLLIGHFSKVDYLEEKQLGDDYKWEKGNETGVRIIPVHLWTQNDADNSNNTQQVPALVVKRNSIQTHKFGINHGLSTAVPSQNGMLSGEQKAIGVAGSHTIFCIGGTGAEAEIFGQEVFFDLAQFGPIIRQDVNLHMFEVAEVGAVGKLEESTEHWVVPVVVKWYFACAWQLIQETPWLKTIEFNPSISNT